MNELVRLASNQGFTSEIIGKSVENKYSNKDFYYLWMCELQKWLREVHGINVYCTPVEYDTDKWYNNIASHVPVFTGTYEEALEVGLLEALKLIK